MIVTMMMMFFMLSLVLSLSLSLCLILDDFSAFDSVCMESTIESSRENESEEICGKKKTKKKSNPLTKKKTHIKKSS